MYTFHTLPEVYGFLAFSKRAACFLPYVIEPLLAITCFDIFYSTTFS